MREGRRRLLTTGLAAIGGGFERVVAQSGERTCGHARGTLQPMQLIEPHASDHLSSVWCVCACAAWLIAVMNPVSLRCVRSFFLDRLNLAFASRVRPHAGC